MTSFSYTARSAGVRTLLESPDGPTGRWLLRKGQTWANRARQLAPVDTGRMRASIEFRVVTDSLGLVGELSARTHYAVYVHEGTRGRPGTPFLMDAVRGD